MRRQVRTTDSKSGICCQGVELPVPFIFFLSRLQIATLGKTRKRRRRRRRVGEARIAKAPSAKRKHFPRARKLRRDGELGRAGGGLIIIISSSLPSGKSPVNIYYWTVWPAPLPSPYRAVTTQNFPGKKAPPSLHPLSAFIFTQRIYKQYVERR